MTWLISFVASSFLFWSFADIRLEAAPINNDLSQLSPEAQTISVSVGLGILLCAVVILLGCVCCPHNGLKVLGHQNGISLPHHQGAVNHIETTSVSEFTIFPPPNAVLKQPTGNNHRDELVTFEPLPDIRPRKLSTSLVHPPRPAHFTSTVNRGLSLQDWFEEPNENFPRSKLQYQSELGTGWFGKVVEGEAQNIQPNQKTTRVIVKILREDAAPSEHVYFLYEVRPFRDLRHPNILSLLGRCLESDPFLVILEHCTTDLKSFLIERRSNAESFLQSGILLSMACNVSSALQHMHHHGFVHTDLAARNCLVDLNLSVKIGDYGTAVNTFKEDYYCLGDIALPIRWCAPESLQCTTTAIETKEVTKDANIWSFGILLWELVEMGKMPYMELSDDEVLLKVMVEQSVRLEQPKTPCLHRNQLYQIMMMCWNLPGERPPMQKITTLVNHLYDNKDVPSDSTAFESRWNSLKPTVREHNLSQRTVDPLGVAMTFENDFSGEQKRDSFLSASSDLSSTRETSSSRCSLTASFDINLMHNISPSLQNLRGSLEDLDIKCRDVDLSTETSKKLRLEDRTIEQQISAAIQDLDNILAGEVTSSETSKDTTPERNASQESDPDSGSAITLTDIKDDELEMIMPGISDNLPADSQEIHEESEDLQRHRIMTVIKDLDDILAVDVASSATSKTEPLGLSVINSESVEKNVENEVTNTQLDIRTNDHTSEVEERREISHETLVRTSEIGKTSTGDEVTTSQMDTGNHDHTAEVKEKQIMTIIKDLDEVLAGEVEPFADLKNTLLMKVEENSERNVDVTSNDGCVLEERKKLQFTTANKEFDDVPTGERALEDGSSKGQFRTSEVPRTTKKDDTAETSSSINQDEHKSKETKEHSIMTVVKDLDEVLSGEPSICETIDAKHESAPLNVSDNEMKTSGVIKNLDNILTRKSEMIVNDMINSDPSDKEKSEKQEIAMAVSDLDSIIALKENPSESPRVAVLEKSVNICKVSETDASDVVTSHPLNDDYSTMSVDVNKSARSLSPSENRIISLVTEDKLVDKTVLPSLDSLLLDSSVSQVENSGAISSSTGNSHSLPEGEYQDDHSVVKEDPSLSDTTKDGGGDRQPGVLLDEYVSTSIDVPASSDTELSTFPTPGTNSGILEGSSLPQTTTNTASNIPAIIVHVPSPPLTPWSKGEGLEEDLDFEVNELVHACNFRFVLNETEPPTDQNNFIDLAAIDSLLDSEVDDIHTFRERLTSTPTKISPSDEQTTDITTPTCSESLFSISYVTAREAPTTETFSFDTCVSRIDDVFCSSEDLGNSDLFAFLNEDTLQELPTKSDETPVGSVASALQHSIPDLNTPVKLKDKQPIDDLSIVATAENATFNDLLANSDGAALEGSKHIIPVSENLEISSFENAFSEVKSTNEKERDASEQEPSNVKHVDKDNPNEAQVASKETITMPFSAQSQKYSFDVNEQPLLLEKSGLECDETVSSLDDILIDVNDEIFPKTCKENDYCPNLVAGDDAEGPYSSKCSNNFQNQEFDLLLDFSTNIKVSSQCVDDDSPKLQELVTGRTMDSITVDKPIKEINHDSYDTTVEACFTEIHSKDKDIITKNTMKESVKEEMIVPVDNLNSNTVMDKAEKYLNMNDFIPKTSGQNLQVEVINDGSDISPKAVNSDDSQNICNQILFQDTGGQKNVSGFDDLLNTFEKNKLIFSDDPVKNDDYTSSTSEEIDNLVAGVEVNLKNDTTRNEERITNQITSEDILKVLSFNSTTGSFIGGQLEYDNKKEFLPNEKNYFKSFEELSLKSIQDTPVTDSTDESLFTLGTNESSGFKEEYDLDDILEELEENGDLDHHFKSALEGKHISSPSSIEDSGKYSSVSEDEEVLLEDLETGIKEIVNSTGKEYLDEEVLVVDTETNEAMLLDSDYNPYDSSSTFLNTSGNYISDILAGPLECILEESEDISERSSIVHQSPSMMVSSSSSPCPSNMTEDSLSQAPPVASSSDPRNNLILEGDEYLAGIDNPEEEEEEWPTGEGEETVEDMMRTEAYTPDFESDTDDTSSTGTSCSSTSGSFECLHSKSNSSKVQQDEIIPFSSSTWDKHATPTKSAIKSPEKTNDMKKSVSFHEEDPLMVYSYPPEPDVSEDEDATQFSWHVDYSSYADWDLQPCDDEDIPEDIIEFEDFEINRSTTAQQTAPLSTTMYSITGISDEDLDSLDTSTSECLEKVELPRNERLSIKILDHKSVAQFEELADGTVLSSITPTPDFHAVEALNSSIAENPYLFIQATQETVSGVMDTWLEEERQSNEDEVNEAINDTLLSSLSGDSRKAKSISTDDIQTKTLEKNNRNGERIPIGDKAPTQDLSFMETMNLLNSGKNMHADS